jgi:hypothetical protein
MGIDWKAFAGYIVAGIVVTVVGAVLYGTGAISAAAVYGFVLLAGAIVGVGFLRWEERDWNRQQHRHGPQT